MLGIGDTLMAEYTVGFPDYVTKGKEYMVIEYDTQINTFKIINDKGKICLPVSSSFKKLI